MDSLFPDGGPSRTGNELKSLFEASSLSSFARVVHAYLITSTIGVQLLN